jgi:hypothetical protein
MIPPNGGDGGDRPQMESMVVSLTRWRQWWMPSPNGANGDDRLQMVAMVEGFTKWRQWRFTFGQSV